MGRPISYLLTAFWLDSALRCPSLTTRAASRIIPLWGISAPRAAEGKGPNLSEGHARRKEVVLRLARIEGHVRGIKQMAEDDKPCSDIILQVSAVQSALQRVAVVLLEDHLEHCVLGADPERAKELLAEMREALSYLGR